MFHYTFAYLVCTCSFICCHDIFQFSVCCKLRHTNDNSEGIFMRSKNNCYPPLAVKFTSKHITADYYKTVLLLKFFPNLFIIGENIILLITLNSKKCLVIGHIPPLSVLPHNVLLLLQEFLN